MFYLIDRGTVCQIEAEKFPICEGPDLYWVEANANVAATGDVYDKITNKFGPRYTLEERREMRWNTVKSIRDINISSGVVYQDLRFDSSEQSQARMSYALSVQDRGTIIFPLSWTLYDNTQAEVSYDDIRNVGDLVAQKTQLAFANAVALREAINSSNNPENIDISVGWPE